jgi:acetylornithine deacetylase
MSGEIVFGLQSDAFISRFIYAGFNGTNQWSKKEPKLNISASDRELSNYVEQNSQRLVQILQDLVRIPSENTPPTGSEGECQKYIARFLSHIGCDPVLYSFEDVPGLKEHPLFWPGRDYTNRPNIGARIKGAGNGRSLLLSGHIDTVPVGSSPWKRDPFGGSIEGNLLYGRGANDMKGGVATNLFIIECLRKLNIQLAGDLLFEAVIDEEFGGVNGTLAGRLKGFNADAVVLSEPSFLRICPAQMGGRIAHVTLKSSGGILDEGPPFPGVIKQLTFLLLKIEEFADQRRANSKPHPLYRNNPDPVPAGITKIITAPWGSKEPMTIPTECKVEIHWQAMPGEQQEDIDGEFLQWIASLPDLPGSPFVRPLDVSFSGRWLPGSVISKDEQLVTELADCATRILGKPPVVAGMEAPCDMFVFHEIQHMPAVLWGARGGNTHAADEFVEIDSLIDAAKVLLVFAHQWCSR